LKKSRWRRHQSNSRGYFDDELTKRRRDWKQCLDFGVPGTRAWSTPDDAPENYVLDGYNQLPGESDLGGFRDVVTEYFDACAALSHRVAVLMAKGLMLHLGGDIEAEDVERLPFLRELENQHTSYLRANYYPPCDSSENPPPLGISPHKDAGFLTVLLQDDDCHSLQVLLGYATDAEVGEDSGGEHLQPKELWVTVHPVPGAFTINTGDMAQIWSNGRYKAPLHRVLADREKERYSAPFFYNPAYATEVAPMVSTTASATAVCNYHPVLWGYFRAVRFAGDLTDLGVEIQIDDFETSRSRKSHQLAKQAEFAKLCDFSEPFSVERYRDLLQNDDDVDEET